MHRRGFIQGLILLFSGLAAWPGALLPCDVPVFRYALERWPAEMFEVVAFHRGELSAPESEALELLVRSSDKNVPYANYTVLEADPDTLRECALAELWRSLETPGLPLLILRSIRPLRSIGPDRAIWCGSLTTESAEKIIGSPARAEIARGLLGRESAVWVLLESGDRGRDQLAADLLLGELSRLEKELTLPEAVENVEQAGLPKLDIGFSLIRIPRPDPAEEVLASMLTASESDLHLYTSRPMAFPVYGRGRALWALVGDGINEENIYEACAFLTGPCACEIKGQNPGMDLLIGADWETGVRGSWVERVTMPPLVGLSALSEAPAAGIGNDKAYQTGSKGALYRNILLAVGLVVLIVVISSFRLIKSRKQD